MVDLLVSHVGGGPAGVVEGACEKVEALPLRFGVLGESDGWPKLKLCDIAEVAALRGERFHRKWTQCSCVVDGAECLV